MSGSNGRRKVAWAKMPAFSDRLTPEQEQDILAYMHTL